MQNSLYKLFEHICVGSVCTYLSYSDKNPPSVSTQKQLLSYSDKNPPSVSTQKQLLSYSDKNPPSVSTQKQLFTEML